MNFDANIPYKISMNQLMQSMFAFFKAFYYKGLKLNFYISNYNFYWLEWAKDQWTDNSNRVFGSPTYAFDIPIVYAHH